MTRTERCDLLKELWKNKPLDNYGVNEAGKFAVWAGQVAALLNFNLTLQSDF